ncbi:MAG: hypothetical protein GHCLOJNM_01143 [bacterium]|nr:hypothetical protein [bacterium]
MKATWLLLGLGVAILAVAAAAEQRFPAPEFEGGYALPPLVLQPHRTGMWQTLDALAFGFALALGAWLLHVKRSRQGIFLLSLVCLFYFGFFKHGCICPIGSTQNVVLGMVDASQPVALPTIAVFLLPLLAALFLGRVFCGGVCALGAIQDLFLWRPIRVPEWLESALGLLRYFYLGLAVYFVIAARRFIICEYDPFVSLFRFSGPFWKFAFGAGFLAAGLFIARPYCRYLCPYGGLLAIFARGSNYTVRITPKECSNCTLCDSVCPFSAIDRPRERGLVSPGARLALILGGVVSIAVFGVAGTLLLGSSVGGLLLGLWFGGVIASRLFGIAFPGSRAAFEADKGRCLSCARCYKWCPYERERLEGGRV